MILARSLKAFAGLSVFAVLMSAGAARGEEKRVRMIPHESNADLRFSDAWRLDGKLEDCGEAQSCEVQKLTTLGGSQWFFRRGTLGNEEIPDEMFWGELIEKRPNGEYWATLGKSPKMMLPGSSQSPNPSVAGPSWAAVRPARRRTAGPNRTSAAAGWFLAPLVDLGVRLGRLAGGWPSSSAARVFLLALALVRLALLPLEDQVGVGEDGILAHAFDEREHFVIGSEAGERGHESQVVGTWFFVGKVLVLQAHVEIAGDGEEAPGELFEVAEAGGHRVLGFVDGQFGIVADRAGFSSHGLLRVGAGFLGGALLIEKSSGLRSLLRDVSKKSRAGWGFAVADPRMGGLPGQGDLDQPVGAG